MAKPARTVNRRRLCLWLESKAKDADDTADHVERRQGNRAAATAAADEQRERARAFRDVAAAVERGEPDDFPPAPPERIDVKKIR